MNILFLGDVVGRAARETLCETLPDIRDELGLDFVIVNAENAAGGFGITEPIAEALFQAGADVITLGNHAWDQPETRSHIDREPRLLRPANYPAGTPGKGAGLFTSASAVASANGAQVLVVTVLGQLFMETLEDPFGAVERELAACPLLEAADAVIVEIHGEATSEKMAMGHFCDGRASLVVGTHTHVPTADVQIFPQGTAYQTDAGMCGDYNSVIGMEKDEPLNRFLTRMRGGRFTPSMGPVSLCGVLVETDPKTGLAVRAEAFRRGGRLSPAL